MIGKFSYGWPELEELRIQIPKQCNIKGDCKNGLLRNRHVLMRFSRQDDFINMMSKSSYYILSKDGYSYLIRPFIYDAKFSVDEETTQAYFLLLRNPFFYSFCCWKISSLRHGYYQQD